MTLEELESTRKGIAESFGGITGGVTEAIDEFSRFISVMEPYIEYFFSERKDGGGFISEIVAPSEGNLSKALDGACSIMNEDGRVHNDVRNSLTGILSLRESVDEIIEMLELVEAYSVNTIIISAKAGREGDALGAISGAMSTMSQNGHALSVSATERMESLVSSLPRFDHMGSMIEAQHENSLTMVQLSSSSVFLNLKKEFKRLSGEVLGQYGMLFAVRESLGKVTEKFQYEDIVRQNIEKVMFSLSETAEAQDRQIPPDYVELLTLLSDMKASEIQGDIRDLCSHVEEAFTSLSEVVTVFSGMLPYSEDNAPAGNVFQNLHDRFEELNARFSDYIGTILRQKEEMRGFLHGIHAELREFESFFSGISSIAKRFKTIILLTSIELSRHDVLRSLLGGTLSDVRGIPDRIGRIVTEGEARYRALRLSFEKSAAAYEELFRRQRTVLNESMALVRHISERIAESRAYHDKFIGEAAEKVRNVNALSGRVLELLAELNAHGDIVMRICGGMSVPAKDEFSSAYGERLSGLSNFYRDRSRGTEYRSMMLASLASEYVAVRAVQTEQSVDFF